PKKYIDSIGFFFFQAEDGIRDRNVTGVQTCALPICVAVDPNAADQQLTNFDKSQDPLRDRLIQLMGEQKKVQESVSKIEAQYAEIGRASCRERVEISVVAG